MLNIKKLFGKNLLRKLVKPSATRVQENTPDKINHEIRSETLKNLKYFSTYPEGINTRIRELDREWDTERVLEANASFLAFVGTVLGFTKNRKWLYLPGLVTVFLFQHAIQGWCPPLPVIRNLKVRTRHEIDEEKYALKALRGDFRKLTKSKKDADRTVFNAYNAAAS